MEVEHLQGHAGPRQPSWQEQQQQQQYGRPGGSGPTPLQSGRTPMHAGPTPMHAGPTPMHAGPTPMHAGPTPMHAGPTPRREWGSSSTPRHPSTMTPARSSPEDGYRTAATQHSAYDVNPLSPVGTPGVAYSPTGGPDTGYMGSSRAADYDAPTPSTGVGTPRYNPQTPGAGTPAFPAATPAFESDPPTFAAPTPGGSGTAAAPTPYGSGATPALDAGAGFAGPSSGAEGGSTARMKGCAVRLADGLTGFIASISPEGTCEVQPWSRAGQTKPIPAARSVAVDEVTLVPPAREDQVIVLRGLKAGQRAVMLSVDGNDGVLHWRAGGEQRHDWQKMDVLGLLVETS